MLLSFLPSVTKAFFRSATAPLFLAWVAILHGLPLVATHPCTALLQGVHPLCQIAPHDCVPQGIVAIGRLLRGFNTSIQENLQNSASHLLEADRHILDQRLAGTQFGQRQ